MLPERGHVVAGGPAQDEAPLRVGASLAHLVHAARRPHLTHTHMGLLLEVVGRPGSTFRHESQRKNTHNPVLTLDAHVSLIWHQQAAKNARVKLDGSP